MSKIEDLKNYKKLLDEEVITKSEFESIKKVILSDDSNIHKELDKTEVKSSKSKFIAALLSIIPGMGFLYLQNYKLAVIMWIWWFFAFMSDFAYFSLGLCTLICSLIFGFVKQGSWGGLFDKFLVDGKGHKLGIVDKAENK